MADDSREYFLHLLSTLRGASLGWIADEIEAEVAAGRLVEKEWREPGRRAETGLAVEEFSEDDRLMIALRIVWERTRVAYALWVDTDEYLRKRLGAQSVSFVDADEQQPYKPFTQAFPDALSELEHTLQQVAGECRLEGPDLDRIALQPGRSLHGVDEQ